MPYQYKKKAHRLITLNEKLYIAGDSINHSFTLQLILEMDAEVDVPSLNRAVIQTKLSNPYVHLRANLRSFNAIWYDSFETPEDFVPIQVLEREWDGHDIQSASFFHGHKFDPLNSMMQVTYIKGERHFLVFRAFHGLMDGMGLYHWVSDIFRAWRKHPLTGTNLTLTDYEFLRQNREIKYRPNFPLDCIAPTGDTGFAHTHYLWHKVTLPGKINGVTAKVCQILAAVSADRCGKKARFMIPVDLRSHLPNTNTTANFANPIFIEVDKEANWSLIYSDIVKQLSSQNELQIGKYDACLRHLPVALLKILLSALIYYQKKKNRYMFSGIVSKLSINLSDFKSNQGGCAINGYFLPINVPVAPIVLIVTEHNNATTICFSVSNAHATREECAHLASQLKKMIDEPKLASESNLLYSDTLWPVYNNTYVDYPKEKTIFTGIWEKTTEYSHKKALISKTKVLTYKQLNQRVLEIAGYFSDLGIRCGDKVAIYLSRNEDMVCSILACWYLGAAYIPIDIKSPVNWVLALLEDAQPALVIDEQHEALRQNYSGLCSHIPLKIMSTTMPKRNENSLSQLAYIIYTSGTTGIPKGVMIHHGQLLNYIYWAVEIYRTNNQAYHTALFTSIAFDLTVTTLYLPLLSGGSIMLIPESINSLALKEILTNQSINFLKLTPSHLRMISSLPINAQHQVTLVVGGEDLPCSLAQLVIGKLSNARIFNEYGPTETTVGCMIHQYDAKNDFQGSVPIGIPAANTRIYCLDSTLKPVRLEEEGEIYIAGSNVGMGYLNQPELTNKRFMSDPFFPGQRMYQSGDLAKHREDGLLIYLGRKDQQIKIRGHRVELPAIENALLAIDSIVQAVVTFIKLEYASGAENNELIAYVVSYSKENTVDLQKKLSATLPYYMVPKYFIFLTELPLTSNGKVDYKKLPKPASILTTPQSSKHKNLLIQIRQLFANVLSLPLEVIDNHVIFGDMGGNSMQMAYMINEMITKMIAPEHHVAFANGLEQLLICPTPHNFYEHLSKII
ncbi:non-ribosomal peptide synthetase [Legionella parisiensis]|uniref:Tyrocidine synthase 3 n=1 Tax=Legionella parisiensis TaxID=45071 RepID=A0A1E5JRM7_9GAMM|nr:non-ribosomal peptide synthetase [Legionella parisiensis]KTD41355.1 non-ribosomal peptide synthetase [Legionella parisiensis]OEH47186.1 Tyrocidine synthase 3 [Legionella parisiensis]STX76342.1 non-ribosomal peptide synthetase [Legionella parisiensis]